MAQVVGILVNGVNETLIGGAAGQTIGFPTQGIMVRPVTPTGKVISGVTMLTTIQMIPAGTKVGSDQWYSPTATATIISACNV